MTYVERIIDAFGGVRPMASAIGAGPSTVLSWKVRGSIPDRQKERIWAKAKEQGLPLTARDFVPFDDADAQEVPSRGAA